MSRLWRSWSYSFVPVCSLFSRRRDFLEIRFHGGVPSASSHGGLPSPRRRPRGGPRQEPTGRPGRGGPPLLPGPSWPPFVAMNSGVFRREGRRRLLPRTSCLCALPGGILETENESFSVQHPLKRQLSTFLSAPTQTSHRQGDTATHPWRHTKARHGVWN